LLMEIQRSGVGIEGVAREVVGADHRGARPRSAASAARRTQGATRRSKSRRTRR
jgi:hypothetical protein